MMGRFAATLGGVLRRSGSGGWLLLWAFASTAYIAGIGAVGLLIIGRGETAWQRSLAAAMTLEIPADSSPARIETVLALLKHTPGIASVTVLTPTEEARLLTPWLGPGARLDGLPMPLLINLRAAAADSVDLAGLREKLSSVVPGAEIDQRLQWLIGMRRMADRVGRVLAAGIAAGLLAVVPTAIFAARAAWMADRELIGLAHRLGATDQDIIRPFAFQAFRLGLAGGAIGGLATILTLAALGAMGSMLRPVLLAMVRLTDWRLWTIVVAITLAIGLIAATATQASLRRRLAMWP
jgi:cell division transport system permease protein